MKKKRGERMENKKAYIEPKEKKNKAIIAFLLALIICIFIFFTDETISLLLLVSNKIKQLKELL